MDEQDIKALIGEALNEAVQATIIPTFCKMLADSDARIDSTNRMIQKLSDVIDKLEESFNRQIQVSELSRDLAQENLRGMIKSNDKLLHSLEEVRQDCQNNIRRYQEELQSAKQMVRDMHMEYKELAMNQSKCTAEVNIRQ